MRNWRPFALTIVPTLIWIVFTRHVLQNRLKVLTMARRKKGKTIIELDDIKFEKIPRGHSEHRSGAGIHADKRGKRKRTRNAQKRTWLENDTY